MEVSSNFDISVVIACHNEGGLLLRSVGSVLEQRTTPDFNYEIVLVPDNPDRDTEEIVQQLSLDPCITIIRNKGRRGPGGARDAGIKACRGEWIALLDGDDEMTLDALASRWRIVQEEGRQASVIGSDVQVVDLNGQRTTMFANDNVPDWLRQKADGEEYVLLERPVELLCDAQILHTNGMMFRKSLYQSLGGFDERLWRGEDTHMWLRLASEADLYFIPRPLACHYRRSGSVSQVKDPDQIWGRRAFELLLEQSTMVPYRSAIRRRLALINRRLCNIYRERGVWNAAFVSACQALKWDIKKPAAWKLLVLSMLHRH